MAELTAEEARKLARSKLSGVAQGGDPVAEKRAVRTAPTVAEICDWYLEKAESGELLGRRRRPIAKKTLALDRSRIETHVRPLLGDRKVESLTLADIERFQADVVAGKTAKPRTGRGGVTTGGAGVAGRTVGMLHTIFEQAARCTSSAITPQRASARSAQTTRSSAACRWARSPPSARRSARRTRKARSRWRRSASCS